MEVAALDPAGLDRHLADLCRILADSVADGAAISFMQPFTRDDAARYWSGDVRPDVGMGRRMLLVAMLDGRAAGTVQIITALPPNQPHRCEIAKMIVHPGARRRGVGRALMTGALAAARAAGKTLMTLDTRTGDAAEPLYRSVGFETAGVIPDYAWDPDGRALHATTYMFRRI